MGSAKGPFPVVPAILVSSLETTVIPKCVTKSALRKLSTYQQGTAVSHVQLSHKNLVNIWPSEGNLAV
jgi:hypothetical protein